MPLDITVPTANGMVDERNRLWLVKNRHYTQIPLDERSWGRRNPKSAVVYVGAGVMRPQFCDMMGYKV